MTTSHIVAIAVAAAFAMACDRAERDEPTRGPTVGAQQQPEAAPAPIPDAVRSACMEIAAALSTMPSDSMSVVDRTVSDYRAGRSGPGCTVRFDGTGSSYDPRPRPHNVLRNELPQRGWAEDLWYAADGPDGTSFALFAHGVTCLFQGMWDGGDDADPTYVPKDWYALEINCLESPSPDP